MNSLRPQYHLRKTSTGIDAWDVRRLITLSQSLPVRMIDRNGISEVNENHWYFHDPKVQPTPASLIEHMRLIAECDLSHPIILDSEGRVMDGMHRVCKAILENVPVIPAVRFEIDPEPDFTNCRPADLPYTPDSGSE